MIGSFILLGLVFLATWLVYGITNMENTLLRGFLADLSMWFGFYGGLMFILTGLFFSMPTGKTPRQQAIRVLYIAGGELLFLTIILLLIYWLSPPAI